MSFIARENLIKAIDGLEENGHVSAELARLLRGAIEESALRERELQVMVKGARAILEHKGFAESARAIFDYCRELTGATSGYVALLSDTGEENEVLFLEAGGLPCTVDPELPMPIRGLREEAYRYNRVVYHNDFMNSDWVNFMPEGHVILKNVMFSPLVIEDKTVGIIGLANKESDFNENDAKIAAGFGELAAIALLNSRNQDDRIAAETRREQVIQELQEALGQIKTLSGLLPICSHCLKVRDDSGYWNRIETYIQNHSEATFSHSICRECAEIHYPGLDIYEPERSA